MICGATQSILSEHANLHRQLKRRSADVGGLHLATGNSGQGKGWVGTEVETKYAELLSDMYNQTLNAVNEHSSTFVPTSLPKQTRSRLIRSLDCWHFEPHRLPEEEVLACGMMLFEALYRIEGMEQTIGISLKQISAFLHHLRKIYRYENTYHNYEHALDVLQATQCYLVAADMVPPVTILLEPGRIWRSSRAPDDNSLVNLLRLRDIFAIYIAAIGHDVGHPGFTNVFMKNAQTPLSIVFDGHSALEQLHCQLLLRVMRHHGLGVLLDDPQEGVNFRKLLSKTVLATDMSVHEDFMQRFQDELDGRPTELAVRRVLISQALLKNADISNPSRPFPVAQHWATALMQEWLAQKKLEEHFSLEHSVQPSEDPLVVSKSQIFFISKFAKPLLDITAKAVPEMVRYAQHCDMNLERWLNRKAELEAAVDSNSPPPTSPNPTSPRQPSDFQSAFPLTLPQAPSVLFSTPSVSMANSVASPDSIPTSPSDSAVSFFSPVSDMTNPFAAQRRSPTSSTSSNSSAIRAAGKIGIRQLRNPNRNSWCVPSGYFSTQTTGSIANLSPLSSSPLSAIDGQNSPPFPAPPQPAPPPTTKPHVNGTHEQVLLSAPIAKRSISENAVQDKTMVTNGHIPTRTKTDDRTPP
ncbi:high-affinity phosphodiesterase [Coprinopsis cinerea okayama7|uniref:Phosphodiesterase n=1 Tax=Coprinopsis cinerea (strain Okayama-7 / 130 / ATCC MYA-4618 / FGSC 9003) TaxID=240176 RepID=A8NC49_COPC7|nr:high-affinity phosphodiesterase [Coprinopsis cinerea okayama7\|eukprot:XP_001832393.2 high-affinity phosphodiesterase [Coprinopsis cinerea okayama7\